MMVLVAWARGMLAAEAVFFLLDLVVVLSFSSFCSSRESDSYHSLYSVLYLVMASLTLVW